jgi:steroid delta-isomerase-like uncharacterized protein
VNVSGPAVSCSRRVVLARLTGGGLGLTLAARRFAVAAQDASPEAMAGEIAPLPAAWAEAWTSGDADQLLALYAEDAVYEEKPTNSVATGHEEIRALYEGTHATFSDIEVTPTTGFQTEGWATIEGTFAGKYTGQLPGLPAGAGQPFSVPFAAIFELDGDKIRRSADYFDLSSVLAQIGAPAAGAEATPTA